MRPRQALAAFLFATLLALASPEAAQAQKVHALLVADASPSAQWGRNAPNIHMDQTLMLSMLFDHVPADRLVFEMLSIEEDRDATPATIERAIERLQPGPDDTVLFYYTGHGAIDDGGEYFDLKGGKLRRKEVRAALEAKKPRLAALVTDCCNVRSDGERIAAAAPGPDEPQDYTPWFRSLFIDPRGVVDVNACAPGESAFFPPESLETLPGSFFTKALTENARANRDRSGTWDELLTGVSLQVHVWFRQSYPDGVAVAKGAVSQRDQNVYAYDYPGMPTERGQRAGVTVRDREGEGAMIVTVRADYPATKVFDLQANRYTSLEPRQVVLSVNGREIRGTDDFLTAVRSSPQVMRLVVLTREGEREFLMRLRY